MLFFFVAGDYTYARFINMFHYFVLNPFRSSPRFFHILIYLRYPNVSVILYRRAQSRGFYSFCKSLEAENIYIQPSQDLDRCLFLLKPR